LEELNKIDDEEMEEAGEEDSDFEHMQKLVTSSKKFEEKDDEDEVSESGEEGEQEMSEEEEEDSDADVKMIAADSDSDSDNNEKKTDKRKSGKKALKAQIQIEKQIREKEAAMREEDVGGK